MENDRKILRFLTPNATASSPHQAELTIRKSRFVSYSCRCDSVESARSFVAQIRGENQMASHNCWAFAVGPPGDTAFVGLSDDGEPRGTAGRPILNVILHGEIGQICIVVSRWFGGIKLGTGGLSRAYQDSALENIKSLPVREWIPRVRCEIIIGYFALQGAKKLLPVLDAEIESEEYGEDARLVVAVPPGQKESLIALLAEASNGSAIVKPANSRKENF